MQGTLHNVAKPSYRDLDRFIPACAGNTKVFGVDVRCSASRFIPACAGNTRRSLAGSRWVFGGSSPRVQGTQTIEHSLRKVLAPVHPRVCREHRQPHCSLRRIFDGSSPRVQGTRTYRPTGHPESWSPVHPRVCREHAHAQSTDGHNLIPVHPRVCREHMMDQMLASKVDYGSSPRVQGTPASERSDLPGRRFIPACAGNTTVCSPDTSPVSVHPRVCREHKDGSALGG